MNKERSLPLKSQERNKAEKPSLTVLERFRKKLSSRLMKFVLAGFLILGGAADKTQADQLFLAPRVKDVYRFVLHPSLKNQDKYLEKVFKKEPEFEKWLADYQEATQRELRLFSQSLPLEIVKALANYQQEIVSLQNFPVLSENNKQFLEELKKNLYFLQELKNNPDQITAVLRKAEKHLPQIIKGFVCLDDSAAARKLIVKHLFPPTFAFESVWPVAATTESDIVSEESKRIKPKIIFGPRAFVISENEKGQIQEKFNPEVFLSTCAHELNHALHPNLWAVAHPGRKPFQPDLIYIILEEGLAQNQTLEAMQDLQRRLPEAPPSIFLGAYDQRVVLSAFFQSILAQSGLGHDLLTRYRLGEESYQKVLDSLSWELNFLGFPSSVIRQVLIEPLVKTNDNPLAYTLGFGGQTSWDINFIDGFSNRLLRSLFHLFKLEETNLSPDFVQAILTKNRIISHNKEIAEQLGALAK